MQMETGLPGLIPGGAGGPVRHVLTLQPPASEAWSQFAAHLHHALDALEEDEFLIVAIKRSTRYVQFAGQGARGMRAEAASNFYLPQREALDDSQHAALLALGWHAPTNLPDGLEREHSPDGSPNYHLDVAAPVDASALALLAVSTLAGVFGATHPGQLEYKAFCADGGSIRFPALAIRRSRE